MQWSDKTIKALLTGDNLSLTVPEYQRAYSWTEDNVDEFFNDLVEFIKSGEEYYLFGQIIIHREGSSNFIVDGQQRITTSTIFLCALRDIIKERNFSVESLKHGIEDAIGFLDDGYRLISGSQNKEFMMNYIQTGNHDYNTQSESDELIKTAYNKLCACIYEYIGESTDSECKFIELSKKFLYGFHVSYVETESLSQAFTVFETLNARGTPLEVPDLLKNHFFSKLDRSHEYIKDKWRLMVERVSPLGPNATTQFIKYYWNSSNPLVREKNLFKVLSKSEKLKGDKIYKFLAGLFDAEDLFLEIMAPQVKGKFFDEDTLNSLQNLKQFGASSFCPLLISLYNTGNCESIPDIVKSIETAVLRNQVIGKKTANTSERKYADWALSISEGLKTPKKVFYEICSFTDSDEDVAGAFRRFSPKEGIAKLLLVEIYNSEHPELKITDRRSEVHLEHIMPKSNEKWNVEKDVWEEYHKRFGNMALLHEKLNKQISNNIFDIKKIKYLESNIEDTRNLANLDKWGKEEIDARQEMLLQKVLKRWVKIEPNYEVNLDNYL